MRTYPELANALEQLVEEWFESEDSEADWDLTTREERIGSMIIHYLGVAHPDDYPDRLKEVIRVLETHTE
jgi:hypothetical protein